jgi:hypothetical protein
VLKAGLADRFRVVVFPVITGSSGRERIYDGRAGQHRAGRGLEAGVGVGDDQLHPAQAPRPQRAQERGPERAVLAVPDIEPQHLAVPVGGHPGGHGLGHDPVVHPGLAVDGVQEHVGERHPGQAPVPEHRDLGVQVGADPADL